MSDAVLDPLAPSSTEPLKFRRLDDAAARPATNPVLIDVIEGPTPAQIDTMICNYESAVRWRKAADELESECKQSLISLVRHFGHPAAGSEHSRRIEGALNTAMVTDVTTTSLVEEKVHDFAGLLSLNMKGDLFPRMFAQRLKHELVAGAEEVLRVAQMPNHLRVKFRAAFAECIKVGSAAPRVKIDMLQKEPKAPRRRKVVQA